MQQVTMIHLPAEKACYMANSVDKTPTPAVLKEALETVRLNYFHTLGLLLSVSQFFGASDF